jgi:hypothetical protein
MVGARAITLTIYNKMNMTLITAVQRLKECQNDEQKMSHKAKYVIQPKERRTNLSII